MVGSISGNLNPVSLANDPAQTATIRMKDLVTSGIGGESESHLPDVGRKTSEPGSADLSPPGTTDLSPEAKQRLSAAIDKIIAMSISGDTMRFLAQAMIENAGNQRHEAIMDRQNLRQLVIGALNAAAGELKNQAATLKSSAEKQMIMTVVGAAFDIAGSAASLGALSKGVNKAEGAAEGAATTGLKGASKAESSLTKFEHDTAKVERDVTKVERDIRKAETKWVKADPSTNSSPSEIKIRDSRRAANADPAADAATASLSKWNNLFADAHAKNTTAGTFSALGSGSGKVFEGAGGYEGTQGQADSKISEAAQKADEASAQNLEGQADIKKGVADGMDDMIKQMIALVKELQDSKSERMQAFTRV